MTSEQQYGIITQPKPTCPAIDLVIDSLKRCEAEMRRWDKHSEDPEYLAKTIDNVEHIIYNMQPDIENIRNICEHIRQWGQEWKELALYKIETE